ncbi:MAG: hypothetical protein V4683_17230 [Bacteroidota bacterium]
MAFSDSVSSAKAATGRFFKRLFMWFIILLILAFVFLYLSTKISYSEGDRAGVVSKFSEKGFLLKTHEGELNVGAQGDVGNLSVQIWSFSVANNDPEIVKKLSDSMLSGKRVRLHYEQKYMKYFWLGDSEYYVTKVDVEE